ncbi:MAG: response regulator [Henriciella sp.]
MQTATHSLSGNHKPYGTRLVLVEDDDSVRCSMTMLLRARGFVIETYRTGRELLLAQGQHGGDCLLIDYKMPHIDGIEVMRRLRKREDYTPGIMVTGFYSDTLRNRALSAGYTNVLEKPAAPKALIKMINKTVLKREERTASKLPK